MDAVRLIVSAMPDGKHEIQGDHQIFYFSDEQLFALDQAVAKLNERMKQTTRFQKIQADLRLKTSRYKNHSVANCGLKRYLIARIVKRFHQAPPNTGVPLNVKAFVTGSLRLSDWETVGQLEEARKGAFWSWACKEFADVIPPPHDWARKLRQGIHDVDCIGQVPILQLRAELERSITQGISTRQQLEAPHNAPGPEASRLEEPTSPFPQGAEPGTRPNKRPRIEADVDGRVRDVEQHVVTRETSTPHPTGLGANSHGSASPDQPQPAHVTLSESTHSPTPAMDDQDPPSVHPDQPSDQPSEPPGQSRLRNPAEIELDPDQAQRSGQQGILDWSRDFPRVSPNTAVSGSMNPTLPSTSLAAHNAQASETGATLLQQTSNLTNTTFNTGVAGQFHSSMQMHQSSFRDRAP